MFLAFRLINFVVISRKTKSGRRKRAKTVKHAWDHSRRLNDLESCCIKCLFVLLKLIMRCPKKDSYQIGICPLLVIIAKFKFVYFCHQKCVKKSAVLVNVYCCYSVKPLHNVQKAFADDCGVCTVVVLNLKLPLCLYNSPRYIPTRNPQVVS
jgi:hypothetical protein